MDSTSPRRGGKASYYSAVSLETGEAEWMELHGNSNGESSVAFLSQLRKEHPGPLKVIRDNTTAHRGEVLREHLRTPGLNLQEVNLLGYSPGFNAGEAVWGWARQEATGNLWLGNQGQGTGAGQGLPLRATQPERRSETALPDRPAVKI